MTERNLLATSTEQGALHPASFMSQTSWTFHNPVRLLAGRGCRSGLVAALQGKASILVVTTQRGRKQWTQDPVLAEVLTQSQVHWVDAVTENPGLDALQAEIDRLAGIQVDAVVGFGGGSSMDAAKALNVALHPECRQYSLAELLAKPALHSGVQPLPLYAVTTTAGTGSEVTPFATIWDHQNKKKLSLAGESVFPYMACVDAELTDAVPLEVTISTGLDAINQAAESIWNKNANAISLGYAIRALQLGFQALPALASGTGGALAREQMSEASLLAGLAISHTRTALCHSISYPMTAHFDVPHGLACAFTMPAVLRHNLPADDGRFTWAAQALTGSPDLENLVRCFDELHEQMNVRQRVKQFVPDLAALLALEGEMFTPGRSDNNVRDVDGLGEILSWAWGE